MSNRSSLAVHDAPNVVTHVVDFVNASERIEICRSVPEEDWDRFANRKYVAVSATTRRLLDGDDDELALIDRVCANFADHRVFNTAGKSTS